MAIPMHCIPQPAVEHSFFNVILRCIENDFTQTKPINIKLHIETLHLPYCISFANLKSLFYKVEI